jgi:hypothetical protein
VARHIGKLRGLPAEEVGAFTSRNFYRLFSIQTTIHADETINADAGPTTR